MLDLSVCERYLANDDDLSPELTQELLDAYRAIQDENVRLKANLANQEEVKQGNEIGRLGRRRGRKGYTETNEKGDNS